MVAVGYMTEGDAESIWDTGDFDTTRFDFINVRLAEMLNFLVTGDATSQITSVAVKPILEQISEEIWIDLVQASKGSKFNNPWDFIMANVSKINWEFYDTYLLKKVRAKVNSGETMEIVRRTLPSTTNSSVIP
jgi:hypothetical protein